MYYKILFYQNNNKEPFNEWLYSIKNIDDRNRILARLDRIAIGNFGDSKHIEKGLYELRYHFKQGYRVYYGKRDNYLVILLYGGTKKTQKRDITLAKKYWEKYKEEY